MRARAIVLAGAAVDCAQSRRRTVRQPSTALIGKPLAIICDARFAGKDQSVVVERLLRISGEDALTVNRKYREQWTGKLPSRLHVLSNELPKLGDASTAIVGRIVLLLSHSWLGREDHELEPSIMASAVAFMSAA
jgi:putative DNA primase/helicase